jgi:AcrR family transcriptional regulator
METQKKESNKTRERILLVACEVFAKGGFRTTTTRDICRQAGVNVAAVNYHFGSKEKLYEAVCKKACGHSESRPEPTFILSKAAKPEEKLRDFIRAFLNMLLSKDQSSWKGMIMGREINEPTKALEIVIKDMIRPRFTQLHAIVQDLLGSDAEDELVRRCCLSITGQCLYYRFARPVILKLNPRQKFDTGGIENLADHITRFSLSALKQFASKKPRKGTTCNEKNLL